MVGIELMETFNGHSVVNTSSSITSVSTLISSINKMADTEVFEDSVGELIEFLVVNFTWGLGIDL